MSIDPAVVEQSLSIKNVDLYFTIAGGELLGVGVRVAVIAEPSVIL